MPTDMMPDTTIRPAADADEAPLFSASYAPPDEAIALLGASAVDRVLANFFLTWGPVAELGKGGIERWIAYPAVLWLAVFGGYLMADRRDRPVEASRETQASVAAGMTAGRGLARDASIGGCGTDREWQGPGRVS